MSPDMKRRRSAYPFHTVQWSQLAKIARVAEYGNVGRVREFVGVGSRTKVLLASGHCSAVQARARRGVGWSTANA